MIKEGIIQMTKRKMVLVICALRKEYEALVNKVREGKNEVFAGIEGTVFPIPGKEAFAFHGRVGKVNTALDIGRLSAVLDVVGIINSGVGGAISEEVKPLEVVIADKVAFHDVDLTAFGLPLGQMDNEPLWFLAGKEFLEGAKALEENAEFPITIGSIISGDKFVTKKNMDKGTIKKFGKPLVVDMESGAVAQCAHELNVPFAIIRSISDSTYSKENKSMYEEFLELAAKHASSVTLWLLNNKS